MKEYRKKPMGAPKKHPRVRKLPVTRLKKEQMTSVVWTTGLGLPIVQPYRKSNRKQVATTVQTVYISDPNSLAEGGARILDATAMFADAGCLDS